jgi:hypothetical protein
MVWDIGVNIARTVPMPMGTASISSGRLGTVADIASAVLYLASDLSVSSAATSSTSLAACCRPRETKPMRKAPWRPWLQISKSVNCGKRAIAPAGHSPDFHGRTEIRNGRISFFTGCYYTTDA